MPRRRPRAGLRLQPIRTHFAIWLLTLLLVGGISLALGLGSAGLGSYARQQSIGLPKPCPACCKPVTGALQRFDGTLFDRPGGDAGRACQPVEVSLQHVGPQLTLVGTLFAFVGQPLAFVGQALAFVDDALPLCDPLLARIELLHPCLLEVAELTRLHMTSMRWMTTLVTWR